MYVCNNCGYKFLYAEKLLEKHGLDTAPFEYIFVCPACKSNDYKKVKSDYCLYCGARLKKGADTYCSDDCRRKRARAFEKEKKRKKLILDSALFKTVREAEEYNRIHKTNYSYGKYVAIVKKGK